MSENLKNNGKLNNMDPCFLSVRLSVFLVNFCPFQLFSKNVDLSDLFLSIFPNTGVQDKNIAYHNVNEVQNSFIDTLVLNLIDIVKCVVFALYSRIMNYNYFKILNK
jgi:hypothetical protein